MQEPAHAPQWIPIFINPKAGLGGQPESNPVARALEDAGVQAELRVVAPAELAAAVECCVANGIEVVGVSGGDGSLLTAANALVGTSTALAPFPTGTLNHFARRLGINDLPTAARALASRSPAYPAVGVVDDRVFLNTATFGLYTDVVRRREKLRPRLRKWPAAFVAIVQTLVRFRCLTITLDVDGHQVTYETPLLWVGVGYGSFPLVHEAPDAPRQSDLEIVVLKPSGRIAAVALLLRIMVLLRNHGRLRADPALDFLHARRLVIHAGERVGVTMDGEVSRAESPIFVGVQEGALRVLVPGAERG